MLAMQAEMMAPAPEAISEEQLSALQGRLESLHVTKLLADEVCAHPFEEQRIVLPLTSRVYLRAGVVRAGGRHH